MVLPSKSATSASVDLEFAGNIGASPVAASQPTFPETRLRERGSGGGRANREGLKTVLVTGANGFIGSNLVLGLSAMGHQTIAAVRPQRRLRPEMAADPSAINYREMQFDSDISLRRALEGVDTVVHSAGCVAGRDYRHFMETNRTATMRLLRAAAEMPTPPHVILLSSVAAAGPRMSDRPRRTEDAPEPISLYGRSKLAGEKIARRFASSVPITILRPGIVFGPGDREVLRLIKLVAASHINFVPGYRQPRFPFVAVDDLTACVARASQVGAVLPALSAEEIKEAGLRGEGIYYVADPEFCSFAAFGRWISQALGQRWTVAIPLPLRALQVAARISTRFANPSNPSTFTVDKIREANVLGWECDVEKTVRELGWYPQATLQERLQQTIAWYRRNGWLRQVAAV